MHSQTQTQNTNSLSPQIHKLNLNNYDENIISTNSTISNLFSQVKKFCEKETKFNEENFKNLNKIDIKKILFNKRSLFEIKRMPENPSCIKKIEEKNLNEKLLCKKSEELLAKKNSELFLLQKKTEKEKNEKNIFNKNFLISQIDKFILSKKDKKIYKNFENFEKFNNERSRLYYIKVISFLNKNVNNNKQNCIKEICKRISLMNYKISLINMNVYESLALLHLNQNIINYAQAQGKFDGNDCDNYLINDNFFSNSSCEIYDNDNHNDNIIFNDNDAKINLNIFNDLYLVNNNNKNANANANSNIKENKFSNLNDIKLSPNQNQNYSNDKDIDNYNDYNDNDNNINNISPQKKIQKNKKEFFNTKEISNQKEFFNKKINSFEQKLNKDLNKIKANVNLELNESEGESKNAYDAANKFFNNFIEIDESKFFETENKSLHSQLQIFNLMNLINNFFEENKIMKKNEKQAMDFLNKCSYVINYLLNLKKNEKEN